MNVDTTPLQLRLRHASRPVWGALLCALLGVLLWPATVGMDFSPWSWSLRLLSTAMMTLAVLLALRDLRERAGPRGPVLLALVVALLFPLLVWREITLEPMQVRARDLVNLAYNTRLDLSRSYTPTGQMPACAHPAIADLLMDMRDSGHVSGLNCEQSDDRELKLTLELENDLRSGPPPTLVLRYHGGKQLSLDCHEGTLGRALRSIRC